MGLRDGLRPIKDGEEVTGYYARHDGVFSIRNPGTGDEHLCHCYARLSPEGAVVDFFEFPVDAQGNQTVGRTTSGGLGGLQVDLYLAKRHVLPDGSRSPAFRYAVPEDVLAYRAKTRANEVAAAAKQKAVDPMHRDERLANMLADALAKLAPGSAQREGGRTQR